MKRHYALTLAVLVAGATMAWPQNRPPVQPAGGSYAPAEPLPDKLPGQLDHPHPYDITPQAGNWCISIKGYNGPLAGPLAFELVSELRKEYRLPAYIYSRSEIVLKEERDRLASLRKQRHEFYKKMGVEPPETAYVKRIQHIEAQYVVLVGGFQEMDAARRALDNIRKLKPPSDKLCDKATIGGFNDDIRETKRIGQGIVNPFLQAHVAPNPTVPKSQIHAPVENEPVVSLKDLNSHEPFSLLKSPGKWTLVVKTYRGASVVVSRDSEKSILERFGIGKSEGMSMLDACGKQAQELARILRTPQLNFESYVLHTRNMSLVTVGSFDSEKDPRMQQVLQMLSKLRLDPEQLMNPPIPYQIPK